MKTMKSLHLITNNKNCSLCGVVHDKIGDRVTTKEEFKRIIQNGFEGVKYISCTSMIIVENKRVKDNEQ